jgi:pimeloyl-ACP methyl ester carboxylesterase
MVDNAGVGRSGGVSVCTVEDMAEHVWESLDAIGLPKIDLLGISLGADVAQQLAHDRPELVGRLILTRTAAPATGPDLARRSRQTRMLRLVHLPRSDADLCDSRSPWQRGTNENTDGLLRDYFPNGVSFTNHPAAHLLAAEDELNPRPAWSSKIVVRLTYSPGCYLEWFASGATLTRTHPRSQAALVGRRGCEIAFESEIVL